MTLFQEDFSQIMPKHPAEAVFAPRSPQNAHTEAVIYLMSHWLSYRHHGLKIAVMVQS